MRLLPYVQAHTLCAPAAARCCVAHRLPPLRPSRLQVQAQKYNAGYLGAKHRRMSHILNPALYSDEEDEEVEEQQEPLEGQFCFFDHEVSWRAGLACLPAGVPRRFAAGRSALFPCSTAVLSLDSRLAGRAACCHMLRCPLRHSTYKLSRIDPHPALLLAGRAEQRGHSAGGARASAGGP